MFSDNEIFLHELSCDIFKFLNSIDPCHRLCLGLSVTLMPMSHPIQQRVVCRNFRPCLLCIALITKHTIFEIMPLVKSTLRHHPLDTLIVICMHEKTKKERAEAQLQPSHLLSSKSISIVSARRFRVGFNALVKPPLPPFPGGFH